MEGFAAPQPKTVVYAGFWLRFVAYVIDQIILSIVTVVIVFVLAFVMGLFFTAIGIDVNTIEVIATVMGYFLGVIVAWIYYAVSESSPDQATPGKKLIGLIVTDLDGNRISFGKASGRYWGKILSSIILMIGFLMAGFTEKKQALHDMLANCLVLKKQ
ncbi:MAG TPA: RDD family protein [Thermodesulfobacteriota bacterium]|nr:RDD family protein [Thermodesulfobacteriota bacterium]